MATLPNGSYQQVPIINQDIEQDGAVEIMSNDMSMQMQSARRSKPLLLGLLLVCAFAAVIAYQLPSSSTSPATDALDLPLLGSSKSGAVAACTFDECASSGCNAEAAPYTCLFHNGGPHGGCSASPWLEWTCTTQCDISGCDDLEIPDSVPDCAQDCPEDWCQMGRLCGDDVPYQCTNGASAFGCSSDTYQWIFRVSEAACSSCCDVTTCA